ncbi:MAG: DUF4397 domain-containing protein [Actinomycetota bacterium]|nr:DUF4397 domain-containing protein [Actinomycetota bacterium]
MQRAVRHLAAALSVTAALTLTVTAPATAQSGSRLTLVHGLPNTDIDAYLDDTLLVEGLAPESITDPQSLRSGEHELEVFEAGADPEEDEPLVRRSLTLAEAADITVVAAVTATATALSTFTNDTRTIEGGQGRLVVRHTSAAETVGVVANGEPAIPTLDPGEEESLAIAPGSYELRFQVTGASESALDPFEVPVRAGSSTVVHLIGTEQGRFAPYSVVVQTIDGLQPVPTAIPTGDSGLVATVDELPGGVVAAVAAAFVLLVGAALTVGVQALRSGRRLRPAAGGTGSTGGRG